MYISGDGISTYHARVKPEFRVDTRLAIKWIKTAAGLYKATDRGYLSDIYESTFELVAKQSEIEQFISAVDNNRIEDVFHFTMSGFESTEYIFGEDVDYTAGLDVTVLSIGAVLQKSWKVWSVEVKVRSLSPSFTGTATLPSLKYIRYGEKKTLISTINKYDTYYGDYSYLDHAADVGEFTAEFILPVADAKNLRRYIAAQRGSTISISDTILPGVSNVWGSTRSTTFPISCKIINWSDVGWWGINNRVISLTLAEVPTIV